MNGTFKRKPISDFNVLKEHHKTEDNYQNYQLDNYHQKSMKKSDIFCCSAKFLQCQVNLL